MRKLVLSLAIVTGLWSGVPAKADDVAIQGVISAQIDAFLADDFVTAFSFASPMIRDIFRTPERFGAMVREGYPMVWRPAEVVFLPVQERNGMVWQPVMVRDAGGALHVLEYQMIDGAGGWQINAVKLRRDSGGTV